jgi:hypothetical protein
MHILKTIGGKGILDGLLSRERNIFLMVCGTIEGSVVSRLYGVLPRGFLGK